MRRAGHGQRIEDGLLRRLDGRFEERRYQVVWKIGIVGNRGPARLGATNGGSRREGERIIAGTIAERGAGAGQAAEGAFGQTLEVAEESGASVAITMTIEPSRSCAAGAS